jgi:hypothetical protein
LPISCSRVLEAVYLVQTLSPHLLTLLQS